MRKNIKIKSYENLFKVPLFPFMPVLVIVINIYLMMASEVAEWIIFGIFTFSCKN